MKEQSFYHCKNCKKFFDGKEIILKKGGLHCPCCGDPVSVAQAHVDYRGGKIPERKIFKYSLPIDDEIEIAMPEGSEIVAVQIQDGTPCLWAIVDTDAPLTTHRLCIRETGHIFKGNEGKYIGTFHYANDFVFHLFEERQKDGEKE
jgi:DNA-directed RNA polymerase subunit RPC12/RpoP